MTGSSAPNKFFSWTSSQETRLSLQLTLKMVFSGTCFLEWKMTALVFEPFSVCYQRFCRERETSIVSSGLFNDWLKMRTHTLLSVANWAMILIPTSSYISPNADVLFFRELYSLSDGVNKKITYLGLFCHRVGLALYCLLSLFFFFNRGCITWWSEWRLIGSGPQKAVNIWKCC